MYRKAELKRKWYEELVWPLGLAVTLFFSATELFVKHTSFSQMWICLLIFIPFWSWGTWLNFTKPAVLLTDDKLCWFGRLSPKATIVSINKIRSVERLPIMPVWRVRHLIFSMENGKKVNYSTGGDENKMKRIIGFIEKEMF